MDCHICPVRPINVGRMEKDTDKLRALYDEGYSEAEKMLSDIKTMAKNNDFT